MKKIRNLTLTAIACLTTAPAVLTAAEIFDASSAFTYVPLLNSHLLTYWSAFTTVVHHHDLLNRSSTAWFEAGFCTLRPRGAYLHLLLQH